MPSPGSEPPAAVAVGRRSPAVSVAAGAVSSAAGSVVSVLATATLVAATSPDVPKAAAAATVPHRRLAIVVA